MLINWYKPSSNFLGTLLQNDGINKYIPCLTTIQYRYFTNTAQATSGSAGIDSYSIVNNILINQKQIRNKDYEL